MRVNVYAEEMPSPPRIEIVSKKIGDTEFTGLRIYTELPVTLQSAAIVDGAGVATNAHNADHMRDLARGAPGGLHAQGPFQHGPEDDDSGAITFWGKRDLRDVLRVAIERLDRHYAARALPGGIL